MFVKNDLPCMLNNIEKEGYKKGNNSKFQNEIEIAIKFWKEYSYQKMKEIMENSHIYNKDSISSCKFLSMRIIKEYPSFEWNFDIPFYRKQF